MRTSLIMRPSPISSPCPTCDAINMNVPTPPQLSPLVRLVASCFSLVTSTSHDAAQGVEIVEPVDARIVIDASKSFTLKCVGDVDRDLIWTYNGQPLSAGARVLGEWTEGWT